MAEPQMKFGLIGIFVRHPTAANLLMAVMILLGVFSLQKLNTQFFPTIEIPVITVSVAWPGASPEDVEKNIIDALEPELRFLDNVDDVTSIAREGAAVITMEFDAETDMQKAQSDTEQAVSQITTLPEDSEEPVINRRAHYEGVAKISISGPLSEGSLKTYAKQIRDGLLEAGIDRVTMTGSRDEEVWIEVAEYDLRRLGLSLSDIADRVRDNTKDRPSGSLEGDVETQLRSFSDRKTPQHLREIEIKSARSGDKIHLGDISAVETRFDKDDNIGYRDGRQSIELNVLRALSADTLKTMGVLERYLEKIRPTLPPTVKIESYDIRGKFVAQRLGILIKNGLQGLALVLIILFIFLDFRIAFWTAMGIPIAFLATLAVMHASGQSINMISMFALIMMLGIIVDDAIVVGEHTATREQMGDSRLEAAERGASSMLRPVLAATLTTQAAFLPIFLIRGRIGDVMSAIPLVVTAVLAASVIECFLVLPGHLRHGRGGRSSDRPRGGFRLWFDGTLDRFRTGPFRRLVAASYRWRYTTAAVALGCFIIALGLIVGGRIGFNFFPSPESENIRASVVFSAGTPREEQRLAMQKIEQALLKAEQGLLASRGGNVDSSGSNGQQERLVETAFTVLGRSGRLRGENVAEINVQLTPSELRTVTTRAVLAAWRRQMPLIAGVERVALGGRRAGPPGRDVDVRLQDAPVAVLKKAATELKQVLTGFPGVSAIDDDLPYGKPEIVLELTPRGGALGFTAQSVAVQVRNAFEGAIATRFARDDDEITIRVLRRQELRGANALSQVYLRSPDGTRVPLLEVVSLRDKQGFSMIQRRGGVRTVGITGDIDVEVTSTPEVVARLDRDVLPQLAQKYGLRYEFKGRDEERRESFADLRIGAMLALALIYIVLAWVFESYAKPLAVMAIVPFGLVGAILGHMVMGFNLTIISLLGLLGLSGILVNDSIILVTQVKNRLADGDRLEDAAVGASEDRLRAVLLTSLTTIGGLLPLLFETSRQAQFLIPMAITLVFGLAAATLLVLVLVPALVGIGGDIGRAAHSFMGLYARGK